MTTLIVACTPGLRACVISAGDVSGFVSQPYSLHLFLSDVLHQPVMCFVTVGAVAQG